MRHNSSHHFEDHEPDDEQQRDRQVASIRVCSEAMRMTIAAIVFVAVASLMVVPVLDVVSGHHDLILAAGSSSTWPASVGFASFARPRAGWPEINVSTRTRQRSF